MGDIDFYAGETSRQEMRALIADIDSLGYDNAMVEFFRRHPTLQDYIIGTRRADWLCHCVGKNKLRCLDIGSGLGNISELLSHTYQHVYSLEAVTERIEFQKRRYKNSSRTNIIIARGNAFELPFSDNYFDLIVCNGVMEWIGMMNTSLPPRQAQLSFLNEVKRVLSDEGCIYIGIENRFGLPFLLGAKDHSGLPFTSILPRSVANIIVRRFGYIGGIYGDKSKREKEKRGYYTYTYSIFGYNSLFKDAGLQFKSYWVYPSYNQPYISTRVDDKIGLKGHIRSYKKSDSSFKFLFSILEKLNKDALGFFANLFTPSFLFYCYKNEIQESLDEIICNVTSLTNFTTLSQGSSIKYILHDHKGKPTKVARVKRHGYQIPNAISFHDKKRPLISTESNERIWIEDWIEGKKINPLKFEEARISIEWLINFQNKNVAGPMTKSDVSSEVNIMRKSLLEIRHFTILDVLRIVDNYESYLTSLNIRRTAEHGDFWHGNLLFDYSKNKINVIDWEYFREKGDPLFDFALFIIGGMLLPANTPGDFQRNLAGDGKFSPVVEALQRIIKIYFGFELNLNVLIPYAILRLIFRKFIEGGSQDEVFIQFSKLLDNVYLNKHAKDSIR